MSTNNVMPRLCGFVIAAMFAAVVIITSWNGGFEYAQRIQIFALIIFLIWAFFLLRAKGWQEYDLKEKITAVSCFVYLGIYMAGTVWSSSTLTNAPVFAISNLTEGIHRDTLYHNALASSIAAYGYPSLLVNSDAFHNYHFGSHYIFGMLAKLMDMPTFFVYCYFFPLLFLPVFPCLILSVGRYLRKYLGLTERIGLWDIAVVMALLTYVILPVSWTDRMAIWKFAWLVSESFLVANAVCLLFFYVFLRAITSSCLYNNKFRPVLYWLILPLFVVILSLCKISVGAVFVVAVVYYLIRKNGFSVNTAVLSTAYVLILFLIHYLPGKCYSPIISATTDVSSSVQLLHFFSSDVHRGWQIIHLEYFFLLSAVFLTWRYISDGKGLSLRAMYKSKRFIIEETLAVVCIASYLPCNIIAIGGGSGFYFAALQQLYAAVLLIGFGMPQQIYTRISAYISNSTKFQRNLTLFLIACIGFNTLYNTMLYSKNFINSLQNSFYQNEESAKNRGYWYTIDEINRLTADHKEDYYIYVSKSANVWKRFSDHDSAIFFYPAMTGVVCIGELYQKDGRLYTNDGFCKEEGYQYKPAQREPRLSEEDAVAKARQDGKKAVIVIYDDAFRVENVN